MLAQEHGPARYEIERKVAGGHHDDDDEYAPGDFHDIISKWAEADDKDRLIVLKAIVYVAVDTTEALLGGEAGWKFHVNAPLWRGIYLLHHAAATYSPTLIELLIRRRPSADVVIKDSVKPIYNVMLPLNVTLEHLRFHEYLKDWSAPTDSIFKLITILCLPQMKVPLEATRLLARHTNETKEEFYLYAEHGHPIQMAVLLMVARDIVLAPFPSQSYDGSNLDGIMSIRRCIEEEIESHDAKEVYIIGKDRNSEPVRMFKDKKAGLHDALLLLDVFEKAGDAIDEYLKTKPSHMLSKDKVVEDVKSILVKARFDLKERDPSLRLLSNIR